MAISGADGTLLVTELEAPALDGRRLLAIDAPPAPPAPERLLNLGLTPREAEVLSLLARGLSPDEVAGELFLSPKTVDKHLERIYRKLGVTTRSAAVARAFEAGRQ